MTPSTIPPALGAAGAARGARRVRPRSVPTRIPPGGRGRPRSKATRIAPSAHPRIAVALHDIEPATFERCALIRDWLDDHGVDRITLLVIPARDLHPLGERSPEMAGWLAERRRAGDSIAQHGFQHQRPHRGSLPRLAQLRAGGRRSAEFVGLDGDETRRAVDAGWRLLKLAGVEPDGFVAPAYAYTPALRHLLPRRFRWWAGLLRVHRAPRTAGGDEPQLLAPAWGMGGDGRLQRALSPWLIRAGGLLGGETLRVDVHPSDLAHPHHMLALEWVLARAGHARQAITYDELLAAPIGPAARTTGHGHASAGQGL